MTPEFWLNLQNLYDLDLARASIDIGTIESLSVAAPIAAMQRFCVPVAFNPPFKPARGWHSRARQFWGRGSIDEAGA